MYLDRVPVTEAREPARQRPPAPASPHAVLALQRTVGNAAVARALAAANAPAAAPAVDWEHIWEELLMAEDGMPTGNTLRLIGELGRAIPLLGAGTGLAADATAAWQDLYGPHWAFEAPITHTLVAIRGGLNGLNNFWGHLNYAAQLIQDIAAGGTAGAAVPFTATVNEGLSLAKGIVDLGMATVDGGIVVMSTWNALQSTPPTPGHPEFDAWMDLALGYVANMGGDVIGAFFDGLDALTAGAAHGSTLKTAAAWIQDVDPLARKVFDIIVGQLQGQLNVRGGDAVKGSVDVAIWTMEKMREAHIVGSELIGRATGAAGELAVKAAEVGAALLDGKDPFVFVREQAATLANDMRTRIEALAGLEAGSANAAATTGQVLAGVGDLRAVLAQLQSEDFGLAQPALDAATAMAEEALATVEANATEIGQFMELVAEQARTQVERLTGLLADIEQDLATADGMEELFERLIEDALAAAGVEADIDLGVVSAAWGDAGRWIEEMLADLEAQRAGEPSPGVDEAGIRNAPRLG